MHNWVWVWQIGGWAVDKRHSMQTLKTIKRELILLHYDLLWNRKNNIMCSKRTPGIGRNALVSQVDYLLPSGCGLQWVLSWSWCILSLREARLLGEWTMGDLLIISNNLFLFFFNLVLFFALNDEWLIFLFKLVITKASFCSTCKTSGGNCHKPELQNQPLVFGNKKFSFIVI